MKDENPNLKKPVNKETELKTFLVNYVGNNNPNVKQEEVTVENIVETMAEDFPEFLLAVAEENWIRGYHQALVDVEKGEEIASKEAPDG